MVTELHRKVALDLCKNYDTILIPTFETSQMTKKQPPREKEIAQEKGEKAKRFTLKFKRRSDPSSWTIELDKNGIRCSAIVPRHDSRLKNNDRNVTKGGQTQGLVERANRCVKTIARNF